MKRAGGFTLVELLAALGVAAVLMAIALPDLRALVRRQQLKAAAGDLFGAVELTRSLAIARAGRVLLAPREPNGVDWAQGWVVFVDHDADTRPGEGDELLSLHPALPPGLAITTAFSSDKRPDYLAFNGAGRGCTGASSAAARWGTLSLFQDEQVRRIRINMLGRARVCDPAREGASCEGGGKPDT
jgi:type IV fimbrial biogenesis protein FimT